MTPSIARPDFDEMLDHDGFRVRRARLGRQAGGDKVGLSLWELPPGEAAYPYHWHVAQEELVVVLDGRPSLRTPDGWRELEEGEVVAFRSGERGAHQLANRGETTVRFLSFSNRNPDIVTYPDSGKIAAYEPRPDDSGIRAIFRKRDAVDYWDGEEAP